MELDGRFVQLGYESAFYLQNLGSLLFILMFQILMQVINSMIALCPVCTTKCKKRSRKKLSGCFFNGVLTTIDGTFLVILLMAYINIEKQSAGLVE